MAETVETGLEVKSADSGKIIFANDVIATIAALAAADVAGVAGMSGGFTSGVAELLGRKNLTKGIKVEIGTKECAVDMNLIVKYGYKIHEVCQQIQQSVKESIEMMTGLSVVEINIHVQGVELEKKDKAEAVQLDAISESESASTPARVR